MRPALVFSSAAFRCAMSALLLTAAVFVVGLFVRVLTMAESNRRDLDANLLELDRLKERQKATAWKLREVLREADEATEEHQRFIQRLEDLLHFLQGDHELPPDPRPPRGQDSSQEF